MVNQLFNLGRNSGAIAIFFLLINTLDSLATEYVFTAPPEVDRQIVDIPASDTEYPLYECSNESADKQDDVLDAHDCVCTDCEERVEDSTLEPIEFSTETESESP